MSKKVQFTALILLFILVAGATSVGYYATKQQWIQLFLARQQYNIGNYKAAIEQYRQAIQLGVPRSYVLESLAQSYLKLDMKKYALNAYRQLLEQDPHFERVWTVSSLYDAIGKPKAALRTYRRFPLRARHHLKASRHNARLLVQVGRLKKAVRAYKSHLRRFQTDIDASQELAQVLLWQQRYSEGLQVLAAIRPDQLTPRQSHLRAQLFMGQGNYQTAHAILKSLASHQTENSTDSTRASLESAAVKRDLVCVSYYLGLHGEVMDVGKQIGHEDHDRCSLLALAESSVALGLLESSEDWYQRYLAMYPGDTRAKVKLAHLLSWQKDYQRSMQLFRDVVKEHPHDVQLRRQYAQVLSWAGDYRASVEQYRQSLRKSVPAAKK